MQKRYLFTIFVWNIFNAVISFQLHLHELDLPEEKLFKIVPKQFWPKEYNGDLSSEVELHNKTIQKFYEKQNFWNTEETIRKRYY